MTDIRAAVQLWATGDPNPSDRDELTALLSSEDAVLAGRMAPLIFGTAGLRAPMIAGPAGLNSATVRIATAAVLDYLADSPGPLVIGFDGRRNSDTFATEVAAVATAAGREVDILIGPTATPVLAYAVRVRGAAAGVMITASHNPPADNGYKLYLADGAQLVPPVDEQIAAAMARYSSAAGIPTTTPPAESRDVEIVTEYQERVADLLGPDVPRAGLRVAYTPLHGVGGRILPGVFRAAGFSPPELVASQAEPDGSFPTVDFPNPEEPGATDELLKLAAAMAADIAIANDPDADRCAVGVPDEGSWRMLTGDEVGVLLADYLMDNGRTGTYAASLVSSEMLSYMCLARGLPYRATLTGFKWIVRAADDLAFGYEEALGYAVAPELVRDKDGISAALQVAALAALLHADGQTLLSRYDELASRYGVFMTAQVSSRYNEMADLAAAMERVRAVPPQSLAGVPVAVTDLLDPAATVDIVGGVTDALVLRGGDVRVIVRPSGTEPKVKAYLQVARPGEVAVAGLVAVRDAARERLRAVAEEVEALLR